MENIFSFCKFYSYNKNKKYKGGIRQINHNSIGFNMQSFAYF